MCRKLDPHQQHQLQACEAYNTRQWFQRMDLPERSRLPPAESHGSPGLMQHRWPVAAAHGRTRQTCRETGRQTCGGGHLESIITKPVGMYTVLLLWSSKDHMAGCSLFNKVWGFEGDDNA